MDSSRNPEAAIDGNERSVRSILEAIGYNVSTRVINSDEDVPGSFGKALTLADLAYIQSRGYEPTLDNIKDCVRTGSMLTLTYFKNSFIQYFRANTRAILEVALSVDRSEFARFLVVGGFALHNADLQFISNRGTELNASKFIGIMKRGT